MSKAQVLVNPVNCVGVMGKGLALIFRQRFKDNLLAYQFACSSRQLKPGFFLAVETGQDTPSHIVNLATKDHWRDSSRLEWVVQGADRLKAWAELNGVRSVACPALGAGEGGLPWAQVKSALASAFANSHIEFEVYEPHGLVSTPLLETPTLVNPKPQFGDGKSSPGSFISSGSLLNTVLMPSSESSSDSSDTSPTTPTGAKRMVFRKR